VEFNCRFGDPETQAILPLLDVVGFPLGMLMSWIAAGGRLPGTLDVPMWHLTGTQIFRVRARDDGASRSIEHVYPAAVTTVLAAAGYPERPRTGDPIALPDAIPEGVEIFHAGTRVDDAGRLVTAGGRVLAVTAVADTFHAARERSRAVAESIRFDGKQMRHDVGWREAARRSGATADAGAP
jgi:phosphoribosylamine--glycine ligase